MYATADCVAKPRGGVPVALLACVAVLLHGTATESSRVFTSEVLSVLGISAQAAIKKIANGSVHFVPTAVLCPGLQRLLDVRRVVNLRNPAHSLHGQPPDWPFGHQPGPESSPMLLAK